MAPDILRKALQNTDMESSLRLLISKSNDDYYTMILVMVQDPIKDLRAMEIAFRLKEPVNFKSALGADVQVLAVQLTN